MFGFILGILVASLIFWLVSYVRRNKIKIRWWGWLLAGLWLLFTLFTIAMTKTLIAESAGKAALVILLIFGVISVIIAVILARFVFFPRRQTAK